MNKHDVMEVEAFNADADIMDLATASVWEDKGHP